jgi:hypothetical protein
MIAVSPRHGTQLSGPRAFGNVMRCDVGDAGGLTPRNGAVGAQQCPDAPDHKLALPGTPVVAIWGARTC